MSALADPAEPSEVVSEYHSFLVRLWREHANAPWRASVQSVQTGTVIHFSDLTRLFAFLQAQTVDELICKPSEVISSPQLTDSATQDAANAPVE